MQPYTTLRERLQRGEAILLDGAIGTELVRRGIRWRGHGMRTDGSAVEALHSEYLAAGADVLRTNTFQLNRRIYRNVFRNEAHMRHIGAPGLEQRAPDLIRRAVGLARAARAAAGREQVAVAGVMSPLEHCFRPDLCPPPEEARPEHRQIAALLALEGADLLLLESMNTIAEACVAAEEARATGLPVWASFVVGADANVLGGEPLADAARALYDLGVEAVLVNCAPPADVSRAVRHLASAAAGRPCGAYAHIGKFDPPSWKFEFFPQFSQTDEWPPERYAAEAEGWLAQRARIVGGCCGTGPAHIRALRAALAVAR